MVDIPDEKLPQPEPDSAGLFEDLSLNVSDPPKASSIKSYRVLARKYRPENFDDLIGQETMVRTLRNAFSMGRVAHAFMLTGVRGIGKTTTARIIARALNCIGIDGKGRPTANPCGVCSNCQAILADRHPDVLEIDAASHTGVDDVREIIEGSRFRPLQARMKVYIIDEVHMLSRNAFNALLKTLEEPPDQVTFIFATTEIRKVPVTVLSRCQRFDLRRVSQEQLSQHFLSIAQKENVSISEEAVHLIARAADGSVRDGLSLLDQAIAQGYTQKEGDQETEGPNQAPLIDADIVSHMLGFADKALTFDLFEACMTGKPDQVLVLTEKAYAAGVDLGVLLADLLELVHLLSRMQALPNLQNSSELSELEKVRGGKLAQQLSVPVLARAWQMLLKGINEIEIAPHRKAAAEMVLIRLCYVADLPTPGDVIKQIVSQPTDQSVKSTLGKSKTSSALQTTSLKPVPLDKNKAIANAQTQDFSEKPQNSPLKQIKESRPFDKNLMVEQGESSQKIPWHSWREIISFVRESHAAILHAHLRSAVHLVKFAPPMIEIRVEENAPTHLAQQLSKLLNQHSSLRWTIVLSKEAGEPTLMEQETLQAQADLQKVTSEPFVQEIIRVFPGAEINKVINPQLDEYGLFPEENSIFDQEGPSLPESDDETYVDLLAQDHKLNYN